MKNQYREHLCIGNIHFSIISRFPEKLAVSKKTYQDFMASGNADVSILSLYNKPVSINLNGMKHVFDSQTSWSLYKDGDKIAFIQKDPLAYSSEPFLTAIFEKNYRHGTVNRLIDESDLSGITPLLPHPLDYPLGEILIINLLSKNRGVMFHSCGVDEQGKGYLFAGNSTHGKSTMARLWQKRAVVLNDDRIIVSKKQKTFWMYGTPWHGDHPGISSKGSILDKIFFLKHDSENYVHTVSPSGAVSMLLARCFPPIWDKRGMDFTLKFCTELVSRIRCYELGFRPDESAIDFLLDGNFPE